MKLVLFIIPPQTGMLLRHLRTATISSFCFFAYVTSVIAAGNTSFIALDSLEVLHRSYLEDNEIFTTTADVVALCSSLFYSTYVDDREAETDEQGDIVQEVAEPGDLTLNLADLTKIALQKNNLLEVVRQQREQSKGRLTQTRSSYWPHLTLEARYSYLERKDPVQTDSTKEPEDTEEDDVVLGTISLSQLLYDFGRTPDAVTIEKKNLAAANALLLKQIQDIVFEVKVAYYNVLEKQRLIVVASEAVNSFSQHLERAKLYLKTGVRTKLDVINAEVELSNARMNLLGAEYQLKNAIVQLEQILGVKPNMGNYTVYDEEIGLDDLFQTMPQPPPDLGSLIREGMKYRPDIIQFSQLVEAAQTNYERLWGEYWPSISAQANYNDYDTHLSLYKDSWEVGVVASWNLFSGMQTKGSRAEAKALFLENRAKLQNLQLQIRRDVTENYLSSIENRERVQIALQTLEFAEQSVRLAEKRYKSGLSDAIEYNDAQLNFIRVSNDLVVTYYGYLIALAGIEHATGIMNIDYQ